MDNLIYSLNAVMPVFFTIIIGYVLRRINLLNDAFAAAADKFNFKITLPALLFLDLAATDIVRDFDGRYVALCAGVTTVMFFGIWIGARLFIKDKSIIGAFVQASYRSSVAVLGIAFMQNIYGTAGAAPIMIIGCVPLYNIYAVTVLTVEASGGKSKKLPIKNILINIIKNPIILAILAGAAVSLINIPIPKMINKTVNNFAQMASPLALVSIGAGFEGKKAIKKIKPALAAALIKTVVLPCLFVPAAIYMGFRGQELVAYLIMLGSPTTPSSYIMAKNMNNDSILSSSVIVMTTLLSGFTLTLFIYLIKCGGFI